MYSISVTDTTVHTVTVCMVSTSKGKMEKLGNLIGQRKDRESKTLTKKIREKLGTWKSLARLQRQNEYIG